MPKDSCSRVALVIGGSGRIGRAIVKKLADNGFAVAVHFSRNKLKADTIVHGIVEKGGKAISVGGNVADEKSMKEAFDIVEERLGRIDVLINTAGIMILSSIAEMDLADLDKLYRTNIRGTFVISQQAAQRVSQGGSIINFSTSVTRTKLPTYAPYVASKAAVESLTMILARELRGKDITVNAVAPGPTATPLFLDGKDKQTIDNFAKATPLERLGTPEDIADTVLYLATTGRWINGQVIFSNGGLA